MEASHGRGPAVPPRTGADPRHRRVRRRVAGRRTHGAHARPVRGTHVLVDEGDIDAAHEIVEKVENAELFLYPGDQHYFADSSLPSYDASAAALLTQRVLEFLDRV